VATTRSAVHTIGSLSAHFLNCVVAAEPARSLPELRVVAAESAHFLNRVVAAEPARSLPELRCDC
jgi:hypothetical protein